MEKNNNMVLIAIVAIVAIVGMILLFTQNNNVAYPVSSANGMNESSNTGGMAIRSVDNLERSKQFFQTGTGGAGGQAYDPCATWCVGYSCGDVPSSLCEDWCCITK